MTASVHFELAQIAWCLQFAGAGLHPLQVSYEHPHGGVFRRVAFFSTASSDRANFSHFCGFADLADRRTFAMASWTRPAILLGRRQFLSQLIEPDITTNRRQGRVGKDFIVPEVSAFLERDHVQ